MDGHSKLALCRQNACDSAAATHSHVFGEGNFGRHHEGQLDRIAHHHGKETGVALLDHALSTFECRTTAVHPAGDHSIVVGEVVSVSTAAHPGEALLYYRGRYVNLE